MKTLYRGDSLKVLKDRRFASVSVRVEDLVAMLSSMGLLSRIVVARPDKEYECSDLPADARLVQVALGEPNDIGETDLRLTFESDSLPQGCHYRGFLSHIRIDLSQIKDASACPENKTSGSESAPAPGPTSFSTSP